jgi:enoyl-CoA hydratase/carnithine racemase
VTSAVELAVERGVARITLGRPETGNRCDAELLGGLVAACEAAEDDERVRVVLVAARGRVFSAGLPVGCRWPDRAWPDGIGAVAALAKPVVAAVQGDAIGWGLALALAADLRIASTRAVLAFPGVADGAPPGGGVTPRLVRAVGVARATEVLLLGTRVPAARAAAWGLVTAAVPAPRVAATAARAAAALAERGPLALRLAKEAVSRALDLPLADGIRLEEDLYVLLQTTRDREEGVRAFLAHRRPRFTGR